MDASDDVSAADHFWSAAERFHARIGHFTLNRWRRSDADTPTDTNADVVRTLLQRFADLTAQTSGEESRTVPRLESDLALADQFRVLAHDLRQTNDQEALAEATRLLSETASRMV